MTTVSASGTVICARKVNRASGESWQGSTLRAWIAWHWLNRYGCLPPSVCAGSSHCRALASGLVA